MAERQAEDTIENIGIDSSTHKPAYNTRAINHALTRANKDQKFLDSSIKLLDNKQQMQFPAIKEDILDYISGLYLLLDLKKDEGSNGLGMYLN
jgi:hypothetical protein